MSACPLYHIDNYCKFIGTVDIIVLWATLLEPHFLHEDPEESEASFFFLDFFLL